MAYRHVTVAAIALLVLVVFSAGAELPVARGSAELWASLSKERGALITLKPDGKADYELLVRSAVGPIRVVRSADASWGVYGYAENTTWPQIAKLPRASRHLWVRISLDDGKRGVRIDLAEINGELFEVDASGIAGRYERAENASSP